MRIRPAGWLLLALVLSAGDASALSLRELEAALADAPPVRIAEAERDVREAAHGRIDATQGLRLFLIPSIGISEGTPGVDIRSFQGVSAAVGLRYPLLGTRLREQLDVLAADAALGASNAGLREARDAALLRLRRRYVDYWAGQRTREACARFLASEPGVESLLAERRQAGLLLEADRLEFLTAFAQARRTFAEAEARGAASAGDIALLVGTPLGGEAAAPPDMPAPCLEIAALERAIDASHPALEALRARARDEADPRRFAGTLLVESGVSASYTESLELPPGSSGRAAVLLVDVRIPLDFQRARRAQEAESSAAARKARLELAQRRSELHAVASEAVHTYRALERNLEFAAGRVASAEEAVREAALRGLHLPGDVLEQEQKARFAHHRATVDAIDAERVLRQAQAALLALAPEGCPVRERERAAPPARDEEAAAARASAPLAAEGGEQAAARAGQPAGAEQAAAARDDEPVAAEGAKDAAAARTDQPVEAGEGAPARPGLGVYLWNSQRLLAPETTDAELAALGARGVRRVLLSLDQGQIARARTAAGRASLTRVIETARKKGIETELLLGEPTWILDEHRAELLDIVRVLAALPFAALHLDLEPNQLDERSLGTEFLLEALLRTLGAARAASPWPLDLSIHPRYLGVALGDASFAERLEQAGVGAVTLMIYVANPARVREIAAPILGAHPRLRFSVAQSLEDSLPPEETHAPIGYAEFARRMEELAATFLEPNFERIVVQSWRYLRESNHEAEISQQREKHSGRDQRAARAVRAGKASDAAVATPAPRPARRAPARRPGGAPSLGRDHRARHRHGAALRAARDQPRLRGGDRREAGRRRDPGATARRARGPGAGGAGGPARRKDAGRIARAGGAGSRATAR